MLDINKLLMAETMAPCDADAFLNSLEHWSEEQARSLARDEGIELTEAHLDVICFLRDRYAECGPASSARILLRDMEGNYFTEGGRRYLYSLFPRGPVTQGCRFAGLPPPAGNADLSFGSVH
ncbi:MAG: TusE/DsrC/DsvC family sulfur relay protein [Betaproteobacteria bacterium]|nr:TusE/DsrC/DsvC family sulfur relay protein [Betaproteobacteria bacterium]